MYRNDTKLRRILLFIDKNCWVVSPLKSLSTTDVTHVSYRRAGGINSNKQTLSESHEFVMIFVM